MMIQSSEHFFFGGRRKRLGGGESKSILQSSKCFIQDESISTLSTPIIDVVECIITVQTDMNLETFLTTTSSLTSLSKQTRHSMECAVHPQPST